jgi:AcrR family transcriptional regulator
MAARPAPPALSLGLAERLVDVTEQLLAREGIEAVTLRRIARRAGVTHGAPLRHYRSLATLLSEVAARGFQMLSRAVEAEAAAVPAGQGPGARLAAGARAYVGCAVANPALFALMFRTDALDPDHETFARDSRAAFEQLVHLVRAVQDAGWRSAQDTRRLAGSLWALMHGLATLFSQGAYGVVVPDTSLDQALGVTIDLILHDLPQRSTP